MADAEQRKSYPMLSPTHWWALRKKFRQSIPGVVTDTYIAAVLNMAPNSARANILPFLKTLGLIDQDGKPTERVKLWRDDDSYVAVCRAMLEEIYPDELIQAISDPKTERAKTERWFANKSGFGDSASKRMAATYTVIVEADPSKQPDGERKAAPAKKTDKPAATKAKISPVRAAEHGPTEHGAPILNLEKDAGTRLTGAKNGPDVNINLQIHISADASPDQIEQIFVSMSKHLYKNG